MTLQAAAKKCSGKSKYFVEVYKNQYRDIINVLMPLSRLLVLGLDR